MNHTVLGVSILVTFAAVVVYMTAGQFAARCEVCVSYNGRHKCETARAADTADAQQQALSSACTQLTSGVTEIVQCTSSRPDSVRCNE